MKPMKSRVGQGLGVALVGSIVALAQACVTTEYGYEPPGQPTDKASGAVPAGSLGVCRVPKTKRPPLVAQALWDHARFCNSRTPKSHVRLGFAPESTLTPKSETERADAQMARMLEVLRNTPKTDAGKTDFAGMLRALRAEAIQDPALRTRVARDSAPVSCDIPYLLTTMAKERPNLAGDQCTAEAYDPKVRDQVCLFDTTREEAVWLTSAWDCVTFTEAAGREQSCHRLCAYDDYCAKQVSCAAPELDLILCALGVCLPEGRGA